MDRLDIVPGVAEPFGFLTWFAFSRANAAEFDKLLARLRASVEWPFIEHEVEICLTSAPAAASY